MSLTAPREAYRLLAAQYDSTPNALIALEQRMLGPLLPDVRGKTVADIAAGTGRWSRYCAARGGRSIAVDSCLEMLREAPAPAVQADATQLPLPDACADLTICAFALGYAPRAFGELARITRRGGWLAVSDVHPDALRRGWTRSFQLAGETIHVAHQPYEIEDLRAPGLELMKLLEPRLGASERKIFEAAGRPELFAEAARLPAIFIALWRKK